MKKTLLFTSSSSSSFYCQLKKTPLSRFSVATASTFYAELRRPKRAEQLCQIALQVTRKAEKKKKWVFS